MRILNKSNFIFIFAVTLLVLFSNITLFNVTMAIASEVDSTAPILKLTQDPSTPTNGPVVITIDASDDDSGIHTVKFDNPPKDDVGRNLAINTMSSHYELYAPTSTSGGTLEILKDGHMKITNTMDSSRLGIQQTRNQALMKIKEGEEYTLSFDVRGNVENMNYLYIMRADIPLNQSFRTNTTTKVKSETEYQRVSVTQTANDNSNNAYVMISTMNPEIGEWFEVKNIKFETGGNETPYSTAYEDDIVKQVVVTKNGTYTFTATDDAGNTTTKSITITNIIDNEQVPDLPDSAGLNFDGKSNYVSTDVYDMSKPYTIQAYVKLNDLESRQDMHILSNWKGITNGYGGMILGYDASNKKFYFENSYESSSISIHSTFNPEINKWYQLTAINTGDEVKLYVNKVLQDTGSISNKLYPSDILMQIGGKKNCCFTNGRIAEVQMWNRELTDNEILDESGLTGNGLIGHWIFDNITTATVYDQSPNKYNGKIFGYTSDMNLSANDITDMDMILNWNKLDNATEYELNNKELQLFEGNEGSHKENNLISDTEYTYTVAPKNEFGEGVGGTGTFRTLKGELSILAAPKSLILNPITLDGELQKSYGTFPEKLIVKDTRKERGPWKLKVNSSPLSIGEKYFEENNLLMDPVESIKQVKGIEDNLPAIVNKAQYIDSGTPVSVIDSDGTSYGVFEITLPKNALELRISPSTYINTNGTPFTYNTKLDWSLN